MERRTERTADTRRRIQRAALKFFVEKGIEGSSIREISEEAGVSLGALYVHFKEGKEQLAWELFIAGWNEIGDGMRRAAQVHKKLRDKMRAMIDFVYRRYDEDWLLVTYVFRSRHEHLKRLPATRGNPYTVFRMVIADAIRRSEIPPGDLELKTSLIVGAIVQPVDSKILFRLKGPLSDSAPLTAECCTRLLGA
jgi:AcrR family transcriptional regulator